MRKKIESKPFFQTFLSHSTFFICTQGEGGRFHPHRFACSQSPVRIGTSPQSYDACGNPMLYGND